MPDREKVIRGLECHKAGFYEECLQCPYHDDGCETTLCNDAITLLRKQEARVLTVEEIRSGAVEVAWVEDRDKVEVIPGIWFRLSNKGEDEAVDIHIRDGFVGARLAVYGKLWRCWTARPTEEQRKAVLWDET